MATEEEKIKMRKTNMKIIPERLKIGDTIGVIAPSNPIIGDNIEELERAKNIVEKSGFKVKFSKNIFSNTLDYSATAKEKADDINEMFADKDIKMIWSAKGGNNSNALFEYLDYELIKNNPKIVCGYSDMNSLANIITEKTGLVTFDGTNLKTIGICFKEQIVQDTTIPITNNDIKMQQIITDK